SFVIKGSTKSFFWSRSGSESMHIKSNLDNFTKMRNVFNQLTSSDILETINNTIERRFKALDELLNKEFILSSKLDENIQM
ncbi:hypothetical protein ACOTVT_11625, partial [Aliarcobacter butzleri]